MNCAHQKLLNGISYMDIEFLVSSLEKRGLVSGRKGLRKVKKLHNWMF